MIRALALALLLLLPRPASAGDGEARGSDPSNPLVLLPGTVRSSDLVSLGRTVVVGGEVEGTVVSIGGEVRVSGTVRRDVVVFGADVILLPGGRVAGDVLAVGGALRSGDVPGPVPAGAVGGRRLTLAALEAAFLAELETSPLSGEGASPLLAAFRLLLLALWLLAGLLLLRATPRRVDAAARSLPRSLARATALGVGAVLTAMLLSALVLATVPAHAALALMAVVLVALAAAKVFGLAALFVVLGRTLAARSRRGSLLFGDPAALAVGLLVLGIVSLVPGVGAMVWAFASLVGVGLALLTSFGSHAPV